MKSSLDLIIQFLQIYRMETRKDVLKQCFRLDVVVSHDLSYYVTTLGLKFLTYFSTIVLTLSSWV